MFYAAAFADDDGNYSWDNYGGIFYDDGTTSDWIEDDMGLTLEQAEFICRWLNMFQYKRYEDIDPQAVKMFIQTIVINEDYKKLSKEEK